MSVRGCVCPHPPLLIPEVGGVNRQRVSATVAAMERLAGELGEVELAVVISPHTPGGVDTFYVKTPPRLSGDFGQFGAPQARFAFANDIAFVDRVLGRASDEGVAVDPVDDDDLDHGVLVPMSFIRTRRLVSLSVVGHYETHKRLGRLLRRCADESGGEVVLVASGDMSHRLTIDGPYRFDPNGPVFDKAVVELLEKGDFAGLEALESPVVQAAGECGLRSLIALGEFLGEEAARAPRVLSYEGPFGVGYLVAAFGEAAA
jgi:aromatic ring-opening dioxygenase LigB subunit